MKGLEVDVKAWLAPVQTAYDQLVYEGGEGALLVLFEVYRPDAVRMMAHHLKARFVDFRAEYMLPIGIYGASLPLERMRSVMDDVPDDGSGGKATRQRGIVFHNAEALLATRDSKVRKTWMADIIAAQLKQPVVIPLAVFTNEAPLPGARVVVVDGQKLPAEKMLMRLAAR
ncbi:MAG: hypothetical protein ACK5KM_10380 [Hyphomicrobiaceae bacterium]